MFSQDQLIFLKTVYDFCYTDYHWTKNDITLDEYIDGIIEQAFDDREYRAALYQKFHSQEQIIYILSYVCSEIWYKN